MPTIRFHGINNTQVIKYIAKLQNDLATTFNTTNDNITLEFISSKFIDGAVILDTPYPMVEILSFKRDSVIEKTAAQNIFDFLNKHSLITNGCDIFYVRLSEENYYTFTK